MASGLSGIEAKPTQREDACVAGASTAEVLRLLSGGATGAILMALGKGPLRTKELTDRVRGYTSRTVYRYAGRLTEIEVIDREEEPGVPSKVVLSLSEGCGRELYDLVNRFANASLTRLSDGRIDAHAWASLGLLGDLWEAGMIEDLSCAPKSPTELAQGPHGLSYHQVNRRTGLFKASGLLHDRPGPGRRRCYELTEKTRRKMGLIAGIARWRHHHVIAGDEEGMTAAEMATVLRVALPLAKLPEHRGKCLELEVHDAEGNAGEDSETVWAKVEDDGGVDSCADPPAQPDGWGRGAVKAWIPAILDGNSSGVSIGGDEKLVHDCLDALYDALWDLQPF